MRKKAERDATYSTWFGCFSEQIIDRNAVLVIYLVLLGGSDSISMFSTSLSSIASVILLIPCAGFAVKFGLRITYSFACIVGMLSFLGMAAAPYAGSMAKNIVLCCCFIFALTRPIYASCWYPLLDNFLLPEGRGKFFGKMRFSYTIINTVFIYLIGKLMGTNPSIMILQGILVFGGLTLLGRKFEMDRLPIDPDSRREPVNIRKSVGICMRNSQLVGFSIYFCLLNLAFCAAEPLAIVYMKTYLKIDAETVMIFPSINLVGLLLGYAFVGLAFRKFKTKLCLVGTHLTALLVCILYLCSVPSNPFLYPILGAAFLLNGVVGAFLLCINSTEMLALAKPGNKVMAMAFVSTLSSLGTAVGRLGTTVILGSGALAATWQFMDLTVSKFQFLFGFYTISIIFFLVLLPLAPSVVPRHHDYYHP